LGVCLCGDCRAASEQITANTSCFTTTTILSRKLLLKLRWKRLLLLEEHPDYGLAVEFLGYAGFSAESTLRYRSPYFLSPCKESVMLSLGCFYLSSAISLASFIWQFFACDPYSKLEEGFITLISSVALTWFKSYPPSIAIAGSSPTAWGTA
jgi:hypothetical protein